MRPILLLPLTVLLLAAPAPGLRAAQQEDATVARRVGLMGTLLSLEVEAADRPSALQASEAAVRALEVVEARLSTWREGSELSRLNAAPVGRPVPLSAALEADLAACRRWFESTGGAFDPGVGALVRAWGLREGGRQPSEEELAAAVATGGLAALELRPGAAVRTRAGLRIEEGGFGKGVGLDAAVAALRESGARRARLDLGGQLAVLGEDATFTAELADPRERGRAVLELEIARGSLATSGNSERGIVVDGRRLGHLLDPRTGRPVPDFGSLTVWAPDATAADCLSTGLYVLGPDAALAFARDHADVEVLVLEVAGDVLRARASAGWAGRLRALDPALSIQLAPGEERHDPPRTRRGHPQRNETHR
jgi:thiamine biosynthesis lipoprotein